jgi:hypothetical protein
VCGASCSLHKDPLFRTSRVSLRRSRLYDPCNTLLLLLLPAVSDSSAAELMFQSVSSCYTTATSHSSATVSTFAHGMCLLCASGSMLHMLQQRGEKVPGHTAVDRWICRVAIPIKTFLIRRHKGAHMYTTLMLGPMHCVCDTQKFSTCHSELQPPGCRA